MANANNQKDKNNFNRIINYEETETLIKRFPAKTMPRPNSQRVQSFTVQQTLLKLEEKKKEKKRDGRIYYGIILILKLGNDSTKIKLYLNLLFLTENWFRFMGNYI